MKSTLCLYDLFSYHFFLWAAETSWHFSRLGLGNKGFPRWLNVEKNVFNFQKKKTKTQGGGVKAMKSPCLTMKNDFLILISNLAPKCFSSLCCNFTPYWFLLAVRLTATTLFSSKSTSTLAPVKLFTIHFGKKCNWCSAFVPNDILNVLHGAEVKQAVEICTP